MSITLYFGKINLISEDIFKIYDDPKKMQDLYASLALGIKSGLVYEKLKTFENDDGGIVQEIIRYETNILSIDQEYAEGWLYKNSIIRYKILDKESGKLEPRAVESTEGIRFCLSIKNELVGFDTKQRFGYREFLEAFQEIINLGQKTIESPYRFMLELRTQGMSLEGIKENLHKIGKIKELTIQMQPPNPSAELLDELQKRGEDFIQEMKDANATTIGFTFLSEGTSGLNIDSPLINERITDLQGLCHSLTVNEAIQKGYARVEVQSQTGVKYTTRDERPYKRVIDRIEDFGDFVNGCKEAFLHLLS